MTDNVTTLSNMTTTEDTMTYQTTLSDADRAILSRLALPALRNESRTDDSTDYRAMRELVAVRATFRMTPRETIAYIRRKWPESLGGAL